MKSKWYFGIVITALTFFVVSQQQITVPNQQIVFQFSDNQATVSQTEKAIHAIKAQLENIGVKNTQVFEQNGILKITYYSDIAITEVKVNTNNSSSIDKGNFNIPEGRAGPQA